MDFQIAGAKCDGLRNALGDDSGLQSPKVRQTDSGAIMRVKSLGLDDVGTGYTKAGVSSGGRELRRLRILLDSGRRGKQPDGAVSEYAVNVKENELDLLGPGFGHGRNC